MGCVLVLSLARCASNDATARAPAAPAARSSTAAPALPGLAARAVTVPMIFEDNRAYVDLDLRGPRGETRRARAWIDTGGGGFCMATPLVNALGLARRGKPIGEGAQSFQEVDAPEVSIGGHPLPLGKAPPLEMVGADEIAPRSRAQVLLPARVLAQFDVVLDYPARTVTFAERGTMAPRGAAVPSPVAAESGFPRVEIAIDGARYGMLLDNGAAYTMVSAVTIDRWSRAHPDWPTMRGAVGEANMLGADDAGARLVRVPTVMLGDLALRGVGLVSRPEGTFETWMSEQMTAPIVGALAGNVLRDLRVSIDYAHGVTYFERAAAAPASGDGDLDSPGAVLDFARDGAVRVAALATVNAVAPESALRVGDRLLAIGALDVERARRGAIFYALHGQAQSTRALRVERDGKTLAVEAAVRHLL